MFKSVQQIKTLINLTKLIFLVFFNSIKPSKVWYHDFYGAYKNVLKEKATYSI